MSSRRWELASYNEDFFVGDSSGRVVSFTKAVKRVVKNGMTYYVPRRSFFGRRGHEKNG